MTQPLERTLGDGEWRHAMKQGTQQEWFAEEGYEFRRHCVIPLGSPSPYWTSLPF